MDPERTFIVAELSGNHQRDLDYTVATIHAMADAGADAVKLQTYRPESITLDLHDGYFGPLAQGPWKGCRPFDLFTEGALPYEWHGKIMEEARDRGLLCFSSPFDVSAVDLLEELDTPIYKVASLEIGHVPLLERIADTGKPVLISTGIASLGDIELAIDVLGPERTDITILKCTSAYPAPASQVHLRSMASLRRAFGLPVGLSDHTLGSTVAVAAVSLGATVVEKHFVLERARGGIDAHFSMEPGEFKYMVHDIRTVEAALGSERYDTPTESERARGRSIYVARDIEAGETFTTENLRIVRPGHGLHPRYFRDVLGHSASSDIAAGTPLRWNHIRAAVH